MAVEGAAKQLVMELFFPFKNATLSKLWEGERKK